MPRRPRLAAGARAYHVLNRRVGRLPLFDKPADYAAFEKILTRLGSGLAIQHLEERGGPPAGLSFVSRISSFTDDRVFCLARHDSRFTDGGLLESGEWHQVLSIGKR